MTATPLAVGMHLPTRPPAWLTRWLVRWARLNRFDSVWVVDHFLGFVPRPLWNSEFTPLARHVDSPDVFFEYQTLLGYLAGRVGSMRLGVGVTEPVRRHPVLIAQAFMTLSHLTRRPPILGIGSGEAENTLPYGLDLSRPVRRLEEALQIIRLCFESSGPIDFQGPFFRLESALMDLAPVPGRTPQIWVAAHGPRMLELAGRFGDGWYPVYPMTPDEYGSKLSIIRQAASAAGRDPDAIEAGLNLPFVLGRSRKEARDLLETRPVRFGMLLLPDELWQEHGVTHPFGEGFNGIADFVPQDHGRAALEEALKRVPRSLIEQRVPYGTPDDIIRHVRALAEAGLRHVVLSGTFGLVSRRQLAWSFWTTSWIARRLRTGG